MSVATIEMRQERAGLIDKARLLVDKAEREKRNLSGAETSEYDTHMKAAKELLGHLVRKEDLERLELGLSQPINPVRPDGLGNESRTDDSFEKRGYRPLVLRSGSDLNNLDDGDFPTLLDHLSAVADAKEGRSIDPRLQKRAGMKLAAGSTGGHLVTPRHVMQILSGAARLEPWLMQRNVFELDGTTDEIKVPRWDDDDRSSDDIAGVSLDRTGEGTALTEKTPVLKAARVTLTKAGCLINVSNELMRGTVVGANEFISDLFSRAVAMRQAKDFFEGTGSGEPLGIFNGGDLVDVATSTSAGSLDVADIAGMISKLENGGGADAVWIAHRGVLLALSKMVLAADTTPTWMPNNASAEPTTLFGHDLNYSDACNTLNTIGDLNLCNLKQYFYALGGMEIAVSTDFNFNKDLTTFRLRLLDAGQPLRNVTSTDRQSFTSANFVRLATRS